MRYGLMLSVIVLSGIVLRLPAQERQPRAAKAPADDAAASGIQVKVFAVRKGDATALAEMLGTLLGQGSSGVRPLRIVPEPRTNSIVAVGAAGDLEVIRALLARLEDPSSYRLQPVIQAAPATDAKKVRRGVVNPKLLEALHSLNAKSPRQDMNQDMNEAATRLESARTELERQESLRNQKSTAFSSSEMARARLAARLAEIQLEQLPKPPGERLKAGFKP